MEYLVNLDLVRSDKQGCYEITALFALLCAYDMNKFPLLEEKGTRVIVYEGKNKLEVKEDLEGKKGHLIGFIGLLKTVMSYIPSKELIEDGIRRRVYSIPEISMREFLANMIVHQDFTGQGERPMVEIYKDKVKISNPGAPLISVDRFIDSPSKSRNPKLAKFMRDVGFCEQRGSGVDRAIIEIERLALPAPLIETVEGSTVVTLFYPKRFAEMTKDDRVRACYQHACVGYESGEPMSNGSLRKRLGLSTRQHPQVSNVIRDAIELGRIKPQSEDQGNRNARYVPFYVENS